MTRRKLLALFASGALGVGAAAVTGAAAFIAAGEAKYAERFYPGVQVDGEHVGGLSFEAALARVRERWDPFIASPVVLRLREREWRPSAREIGISVDYRTALRDAYEWGREGDLDRRFEQQRLTASAPLDWPVAVRFDPYEFEQYVERIAAQVARPVADAQLRVANVGGQDRLVLSESQRGARLAAADYLSVMSAAFAPPRRLVIELDLEQIEPAVTTEALAPIAAETQQLFGGHIGVVSQSYRWAIPRDQLVTGVTVGGPAHAPEISLAVDYATFEPLARRIADRLRVDPVEPKIRVDSAGRIKPTVQGRPGRKVDVEELWRRLRTAFSARDPEIQVPLILLKPDVSQLTVEELQFENLLATGNSHFWGSEDNRVENIGNGSAKIDGTVLAPDEQFSFNEVVGPITEANGFVEGLVIAPNRTEPGIGGGICQVSTTLFRAVFWAGLPVDERWQHAYRVGYYELGEEHPPGFDAAIWQPSQDLRFTNDTPNYLLIRREFDSNRQFLRFHIMGAPLGRTVDLEPWEGEPVPPPPIVVAPGEELAPGEVKQTDSAIEGLQTIVHRTVSLGARVLFKDQFRSKFRPWPERWEVGPNPDGSLDTSKIPDYPPAEDEGAPAETGASAGSDGAA